MWFQLKHLQHKVCLFNLLLTDDLTFNIPLKKLSNTTQHYGQTEDNVFLPLTTTLFKSFKIK